MSEGLLGGVAIHKTGKPFPEETKRLALSADATLMGAVGLPEFDLAPPSQRPEAGLLEIRSTLDALPIFIPEGLRHGINDYSKWFSGDSQMQGQYYGHDGPAPPWNDSIVHHYVFTLLRS